MTDHTDPLKAASASEIADLLEHGGVPIDQVASLCRRSIELLREYASLTAFAPKSQQAQSVEYLLRDDLFDSKDWRDSGVVGRIEWLLAMYESKKQELEYMEQQAQAGESRVAELTEIEVRRAAHPSQDVDGMGGVE